MVRLFLTPPTILAILHISVPLLLFHVAPKFRHVATIHIPGMNASDATAAHNANATAWIQSRLTALHEDVHVQDAFDRTFSPACDVRANHEPQGLQTLRDELIARRGAATNVSVAWEGDVIATNDDKPEESSVVAGAFVVTRSLPFRVRVSPVQRRTHVRFSAKIEQDAGVEEGDRRRITSFYYTSVDRTPPIHFAVPRVAREGVDGQ